jgi:hypothetical protein
MLSVSKNRRRMMYERRERKDEGRGMKYEIVYRHSERSERASVVHRLSSIMETGGLKCMTLNVSY